MTKIEGLSGSAVLHPSPPHTEMLGRPVKFFGSFTVVRKDREFLTPPTPTSSSSRSKNPEYLAARNPVALVTKRSTAAGTKRAI